MLDARLILLFWRHSFTSAIFSCLSFQFLMCVYIYVWVVLFIWGRDLAPPRLIFRLCMCVRFGYEFPICSMPIPCSSRYFFFSSVSFRCVCFFLFNIIVALFFGCRLRFSLIFSMIKCVLLFVQNFWSELHNVVFGFDVFIFNFGHIFFSSSSVVLIVIVCYWFRFDIVHEEVAVARYARNILVNRCLYIVTIEWLRVPTRLSKKKRVTTTRLQSPQQQWLRRKKAHTQTLSKIMANV